MLPVAMPTMFATEPLEATAVATGPGSRTNRRRRNGASVFFTNYSKRTGGTRSCAQGARRRNSEYLPPFESPAE